MPAYVTDTHPLLWYAHRQFRRLSTRAARIFAAADAGTAFVSIPAAALWEVALLLRAGRITLREPFDEWAEQLDAHPGFEIVPLDRTIVARAFDVTFTDDPFDAAIVAAAVVLDRPLITKDRTIIASGAVSVTW
jgi:PIN domain nuclease of toxin-antitoxin system